MALVLIGGFVGNGWGLLEVVGDCWMGWKWLGDRWKVLFDASDSEDYTLLYLHSDKNINFQSERGSPGLCQH